MLHGRLAGWRDPCAAHYQVLWQGARSRVILLHSLVHAAHVSEVYIFYQVRGLWHNPDWLPLISGANLNYTHNASTLTSYLQGYVLTFSNHQRTPSYRQRCNTQASIIVFLLALVIATGGCLTAAFGGRVAILDLARHNNIRFNSLCS